MKPTQATRIVDSSILAEIKQAISHIKWGSIEIFIQDGMVVQITERNIKKMQDGKK